MHSSACILVHLGFTHMHSCEKQSCSCFRFPFLSQLISVLCVLNLKASYHFAFWTPSCDPPPPIALPHPPFACTLLTLTLICYTMSNHQIAYNSYSLLINLTGAFKWSPWNLKISTEIISHLLNNQHKIKKNFLGVSASDMSANLDRCWERQSFHVNLGNSGE